MLTGAKTLTVDETTWRRLTQLKLETGARSLDEVISNLLKEAEA
jgi:predicted CopG family antitoxin